MWMESFQSLPGLSLLSSLLLYSYSSSCLALSVALCTCAQIEQQCMHQPPPPRAAAPLAHALLSKCRAINQPTPGEVKTAAFVLTRRAPAARAHAWPIGRWCRAFAGGAGAGGFASRADRSAKIHIRRARATARVVSKAIDGGRHTYGRILEEGNTRSDFRALRIGRLFFFPLQRCLFFTKQVYVKSRTT